MSLTDRVAGSRIDGPTGEGDGSASQPSTALVDAAFGLVLAATFFTYMRLTSGYFFWADDWQLARRGHSLGDFFRPYNEHLTIVPIAIYRVVFAVFGFHTYVPLRFVVVASVCAISLAMYWLARARIGAVLAAALAIWLLWSPGFTLFPATFNHYLALAATIVCAIQLMSTGRRADVTLGIALTFALCTSGVGVAAAVGCLAHAAVSRSSLRRFVVLAIPSALWAVWWLARGRTRTAGVVRPTGREMVDATFKGIWHSFESLAAGNRVFAAALVVLFIVNLLWCLSRGARAAANSIAWTAALIFWWAGLAYNRGPLVTLDAFRYAYVGGILIVLALMPARPLASTTWSLRQPVAAACVLALGLAIAYANHGETFRAANTQENYGRLAKQLAVVANIGPRAVPDDVLYTLHLGFITAGQYRELVDEYGTPFDTKVAAPDAAIVRLGNIEPRVQPRAPSPPCAPRRTVVRVPADAVVTVRTEAQGTRVNVRRFGAQYVPVGQVPADSSATLTLPGLFSKTPWMVSVERGCLVVH